MKKALLIFFLIFSYNQLIAQVEDAWVYFKDKPNEVTYMNSPITMLTQRALDRRSRYNISIDVKDVPIETSYVSQIKNSVGITIKARSKWLNALHVQGSENDIKNLLNLNFVESIYFANKLLNTVGKSANKSEIQPRNKEVELTTQFNYGNATNQIEMLQGHVLHENNFTGEGMQIAVIDAGFPNVDVFPAFQRLRDNNQILGGYDFVNRNDNFYTGYYHGMSVLSTIAGYIDNQFVGTAPDAKFYLFISEDNVNETPLEESLWVEAAERADSLGVDLINTSLGYTTFDNPNYDYEYADMDGQTTFISRGAEIAASRGMIVVNSAGNEGNSSWNYISAPADANSVLSIGAVDAAETIASFSSYGPTSDGRIKPDVCAQGKDVYIINSAGNVAISNGTSFSSPVLTGVVACLWQAFPEKSNTEIIQLVKESSHLFASPTAQEGYGIPNFEAIYSLLSQDVNDLDGDSVLNEFDACPNTPIGTPVNENGCLLLPSNNFSIEVIGESCPDRNNGEITITALESYNYTATINGSNYTFSNNELNIIDLESGEYEVCIFIEDQSYSQCYTIQIAAGSTISGKASISSKSVVIEIDEGTSPFTIFVNGDETMQTLNNKFEVAVNQGDFVEVKSSIACEGVFSKEIVFEGSIHVFPNPAKNSISLNFPEAVDQVQITIFSLLGKSVLTNTISKNNPVVDISSLNKGLYMVQITYNDTIKTIKVLKN
ncbi:MAG: S8 family serine peptidase [Lutibacter sp.]|uniref:S8 family serine peptidase n=1 Tax=Lutibacter sp. TaxID=1925666 RepID=UPI0017D6DC7D|nr:S8 family serine peptidase [Lutibacter sp.]MBT8316909.1 S8 family serine peptidase [Lutibacter sp.]NNJ57769.1 S8 family serine peptidase [Lutibacter sp.]